MSTQFIRRPARSGQNGTSLIEILVVLVILVVGILSIVRLFPAGFLALRNAENSTFAARLATGALEQLKKGGNGLPDAIYMYVNNGFDPNYSPTDFTTYTSNAAYNDINKQRYISNETITVPATRMVSSTSFLPLYVLNYGPVSLPDLNKNGDLLKVISEPWTPQTGDARLVGDFTRHIDEPTEILQAGDQKFLVDYNGGKLAVPAAAYTKFGSGFINQDFVAVVTTGTGSTAVSTTVPLSIPNTYDGGWFDGATSTNATFSNIALPIGPWTSVTLYRPFRNMGISNSPSWDGDPYEFAVYSSNFDSSTANPGVIAFNPLASGRNGTAPLKARISYMSLDWHILHEDHDVSAGSPSVRLTLGHLKKVGDVQFDQTNFTGLITAQNAVTVAKYQADIAMLNLDTGLVTTLNGQDGTSRVDATDPAAAAGPGVLDADQAPAPDATKYQVSYQNGRITFPDGSPAQHLRFFYTGDADWALGVQKAASVYNAAPTAATLATAGANTPNNYFQNVTDSTQVYFPVCDAGKTVEFDGITYTDAQGKTQQVGEGTAQLSTSTISVGGNNLVSVNLSTSGLNSSNILPNVDNTKPVTFQAVRGISAQAVVIWHERNNWRSRTIDTLLTQTP